MTEENLKLIKIDSLPDAIKAISFIQILNKSRRESLTIRIVNYLRQSGNVINITRNHPIVKHLKPHDIRGNIYQPHNRNIKPVFDIVGGDVNESIDDIYHVIEEAIKNETLPDYVERSILSIFMNNRDLENLYYDSKYFVTTLDKLLDNVEYGFKALHVLNNIILSYCNKLWLSLTESMDLVTFKQRSIMNSYFQDLNNLIYTSTFNNSDLFHIIDDYIKRLIVRPIEVLAIVKLFYKRLEVKPDNTLNIDDIKSKWDSLIIDKSFLMVLKDTKIQNDTPYSYMAYNGSNVINTLDSMNRITYNGIANYMSVNNKKFIFEYSTIMSGHSYDWLRDTLMETLSKNSVISSLLSKMKLEPCNGMSTLYALHKSNIIESFIKMRGSEIGILHIGVVKKTAYIITTAKESEKIYLVPIFRGHDLLENLLEDKKVRCRSIIFRDSVMVDEEPNIYSLLESSNKIELDKGGNIKFKFKTSKKNTYMTDYNNIHVILKSNSDHKKYEAMKTDLALMYGLICLIEKDVIYNTGFVPASVRSDATKARMFAKNDMKRYLTEVQKNDNSFNFQDYYKQSGVPELMEKEYEVKLNLPALKNLVLGLF